MSSLSRARLFLSPYLSFQRTRLLSRKGRKDSELQRNEKMMSAERSQMLQRKTLHSLSLQERLKNWSGKYSVGTFLSFLSMILASFVITSLITVFVGSLYWHYKSVVRPLKAINEANEKAVKKLKRKLNSTFSVLGLQPLYPPLANRQAEKERLKMLLREPTGRDRSYYVVVGPHRSGKSTLMEAAVKELAEEGVLGIVFVEAGRTRLSHTLADTLCLNHPAVLYPEEAENVLDFERVSQLSRGRLPDDEKEALALVFRRISYWAKKCLAEGKTKRFPTIIIDNVNKLLPKNRRPTAAEEETLIALQSLAKTYADKGTIRIILIDSAGTALGIMKEISYKSRMKVIIAQDVVEAKAKEYLEDNLKDTNVRADSAFAELTGCRLGLLRDVIYWAHMKSEDGQLLSYDAVRNTILDGALLALKSLNLQDDSPKAEYQSNVIRALLSNPVRECQLPDVKGLTGAEERDALNELMRKEITRYASMGHISLHSQAMITAAKELSPSWT